jgi:hypothetical protein
MNIILAFKVTTKGFLYERWFRGTIITIAGYTQTTNAAIAIILAGVTILTFNFS